MKKVKTKFQSDGSKLEKIERFTVSGYESGFYQNGVRIADIDQRLDLNQDEQDWLALKPKGNRYYTREENPNYTKEYFGELDENNEYTGRGI